MMALHRDATAPPPPPMSRKCGEPLERQTLAGRLPPEVIQRIVRASFDTYRACYNAGLGRNPKLEGKVTVKFVIDREGHVAMSAILRGHQAPGSDPNVPDMPDDTVSECVAKAFGHLTFPKPEGGMVTVVYPIVFSAED